MPSTEPLPSGRFRAIYRDASAPNGKARVPGTFATEREALKKAAAAEEAAEQQTGGPATKWARSVTLGEILADWRHWRRVAPGTAKRDDSRIDLHVTPRWGSDALSTITREGVENWVFDELCGEKKLSPSTARKCYFHLSSMLGYAVSERKILTENPAAGAKLPDTHAMPAKFISDEAHRAIWATMPPEYQDVLDVLDETGLRPGELQGLHAEDIDLAGKLARIVWSYDAATGILKELKDKDCRSVPLGDKSLAIFARLIKEHGYGQPAPVRYVKRTRDVESGLIFRQANGRPVSDSEFRKSLRASARIAYEGTGKARRNVGRVFPYMWRHRYAKRLLLAGLSIDELSVLMGHSSIDITKKWYGDLGVASWDRVRSIINGDTGPGTCPTCRRPTKNAA
ncbi:tyrosine-type recombinase/integrase [Nocardia salmonicida]|uniref:tyrosine-type recombinase/integrase n=1 Tax=Nocardia salmonicida TaxID=53431 RepID=UPI00340FD221